jgi:ADP-dependent phosphofructokinase/glucokinase
MINKCIDLAIVLTKMEIEHIQSLRLNYHDETKAMQNMENENFSKLIELIHQHDFYFKMSEDPRKLNEGYREEDEIKKLMKDFLWEDIEPCIKEDWRKERLMFY